MNDRILSIREAFKMSQETFGKKLGITRAAVSKIELGKSGLTESNIKLICREFSISENWLRTGEGDMFPPTTDDEEIASLFGKLISDEDPLTKAILKDMLELMNDITAEEWGFIKKKIKKWSSIIDNDTEVR